MSEPRLRPLPDSRRSRRVIAIGGAAVAIAGGHLLLLIVLNLGAERPEPTSPEDAIRLERDALDVNLAPPPERAARSRRRRKQPAPQAQAEALPLPAPGPAQTPALQPAKPDYGRWTVAPSAPAAQGGAPGLPGLAGCTPLTLASLTGAAREACARRLSEAARNAPPLPLIGDKRKAKELQAQEDYRSAVAAWRRSRQMGPHPCPPQDEPAHKLYLDKCSLVNAARRVNSPLGPHPAVKVEFKVKF